MGRQRQGRSLRDRRWGSSTHGGGGGSPAPAPPLSTLPAGFTDWVLLVPQASRGKQQPCWVLDFWPPELETVYFCCCKPPSLWSICYSHPRKHTPGVIH